MRWGVEATISKLRDVLALVSFVTVVSKLMHGTRRNATVSSGWWVITNTYATDALQEKGQRL